MGIRERVEAQRKRAKLREGVALRDRGLTMKTRIRYFTAVQKVLPILVAAPSQLDDVLMEWIEDQYTMGINVSYVGDALSGLHHFAPWIRGQIKGSWQLFRLWRRVEKPTQAPPLPELFIRAMVARCLELQQLDMALCLSLGFWGLLRTGEIMALYPSHLLLGSSDLILRLGLTKTGTRRHQDENVVVKDRATRMIAETFLQVRKGQGLFHLPCMAAGGHVFRHQFKQLLQFFRLSANFRPYSLRRGGATADFRRFNSLERTLIKGRWGTSQAARQYIQEGLSVLTQITITESQQQLLQAYAQLLAPSSSPQEGPGKGARKSWKSNLPMWLQTSFFCKKRRSYDHSNDRVQLALAICTKTFKVLAKRRAAVMHSMCSSLARTFE